MSISNKIKVLFSKWSQVFIGIKHGQQANSVFRWAFKNDLAAVEPTISEPSFTPTFGNQFTVDEGTTIEDFIINTDDLCIECFVAYDNEVILPRPINNGDDNHEESS